MQSRRIFCAAFSAVSTFLALQWLPAALAAQILFQNPQTGKLDVRDFGEQVGIDLMDYPQALASEDLCPNRIVFAEHRIAIGHNETSILRKLGSPSSVLHEARELSPLESNAFFRELLLQQPNTMHFYALLEFRDEIAAGWFKSLRWTSPIWGEIDIHFASPSGRGPFVARFIQLRLGAIDESLISRTSGPEWILIRDTSPKVSWNVAKNRVYIGGEP